MISLPVLLAGICGVTMLVVHAFRHSMRRIWITSVEFFRVLPVSKARRNWAWAWPDISKLSLWLRMLAMAAIFVALIMVNSSILSRKLGRRLWIVVDVSASMSTRQAGQTRLELAKSYVRSLLERSEQRGEPFGDALRVKVWGAHRSLQPITDLVTANAALKALAIVEWQRRGTDWNAVAAMLNKAISDEQQAPSHIVVVSDLPPSPGLRPPEGCAVTWCDIADSVNNSGLYRLQPILDPFTSKLLRIDVDFVSYGDPLGQSELLISGPYEGDPARIFLDWKGLTITRYSIDDPVAGRYVLELRLDGDSYEQDNSLAIVVRSQENRNVVVDWRLDDRSWLDEIGRAVTLSAESPDIRVAYMESITDFSVPTLCTTRSPSTHPSEFGMFNVNSPLLADVNLNSLEESRLSSRLTKKDLQDWLTKRGRNPASLATVLQDAGNPAHVILAIADESEIPPVVFLPTLPPAGKQPNDISVEVLFWNTIQWLIANGRQRAADHLVEIGDPSDIEPRLPLEIEEGRTDHAGGPMPPVELALEGATNVFESGFWRVLVLAAAVLMMIERCGTFICGNDWSPQLPRRGPRSLHRRRVAHELRT